MPDSQEMAKEEGSFGGCEHVTSVFVACSRLYFCFFCLTTGRQVDQEGCFTTVATKE